MKTQVYQITNEEVLHIYLSSEEEKSIEIQEEIKELKNIYKKVCIFISGKEQIETAVKEIVDYMKMSST